MSSSASRRNVRLRREYLYKKSLEGKDRELYDKKERLKSALSSGKQIPVDLKRDVASLKHEIELEDELTVAPKVRRLLGDPYVPLCRSVV